MRYAKLRQDCYAICLYNSFMVIEFVLQVHNTLLTIWHRQWCEVYMVSMAAHKLTCCYRCMLAVIIDGLTINYIRPDKQC